MRHRAARRNSLRHRLQQVSATEPPAFAVYGGLANEARLAVLDPVHAQIGPVVSPQRSNPTEPTGVGRFLVSATFARTCALRAVAHVS
jgi:hypothetical protein